jgi:hypothetical protein
MEQKSCSSGLVCEQNMATNQNLSIVPPANLELGMQVLKHSRPDGTPVYTIGIWENGSLRSICHATPIAAALLAVHRELENVSPHQNQLHFLSTLV